MCDKLRPSLAALAGTTGFRALLLRALALAAIEVPWLQVAHVSAEGTLECPVEPAGEVDSRQFAEGGVVLIAQLLGLLVAFIGEDLTLRLACDVWPKLSRDGFRTGNRRGR